MIISVLGSSVNLVDLGKYLPSEQVELVCSNRSVLDRQVKEYADNNNMPCLILNMDKHSRSKMVLSETKRTMIDMCDTVLIFWDGRSKNVTQFITYCELTGTFYSVHQLEGIKFA